MTTWYRSATLAHSTLVGTGVARSSVSVPITMSFVALQLSAAPLSLSLKLRVRVENSMRSLTLPGPTLTTGHGTPFTSVVSDLNMLFPWSASSAHWLPTDTHELRLAEQERDLRALLHLRPRGRGVRARSPRALLVLPPRERVLLGHGLLGVERVERREPVEHVVVRVVYGVVVVPVRPGAVVVAVHEVLPLPGAQQVVGPAVEAWQGRHAVVVRGRAGCGRRCMAAGGSRRRRRIPRPGRSRASGSRRGPAACPRSTGASGWWARARWGPARCRCSPRSSRSRRCTRRPGTRPARRTAAETGHTSGTPAGGRRWQWGQWPPPPASRAAG
mmetsp:Transcript_28395/g.96621  ORF Transcript_28395/g.96621 Transcript_28395/m.96621 type:complete len:330 (-) Transcript_28395:52-1041(-)